MKPSSLPLIGISLDSVDPSTTESPENGYSRYPWYALRENYCEAIAKSGGVPILFPHENDFIEDYLNNIDGLLIPGGPSDIDPRLFGDTFQHPTVSLNPRRTCFELELLKKALLKNIPILGICGGHQLINVAFGGSLIQHIPDAVKSALPHKKLHHELAHSISIIPDTHLARILENISSLDVNSVHHQSIKVLGQGLRLSAQASDGIIEGIESINHSFVLGIQWHPEFTLCAEDSKIFNAFIQAAQQKASSK